MQTILTQCPRCQTSFKVSDKQLAIASGMVRCGSCLDVFSAPENRITIKQPASAIPSPEHFPDDELGNEGDTQVQPPAISSPSNTEATGTYHQQTSIPAEPSALHPAYESPAHLDAGRVTGSGLTDTTASATLSSSDEELEFILDYEDDIQLGDMMLDDAAHDKLFADVFDVAIHDAGNVAESNTDATTLSETTFNKEFANSDSQEIGYIPETPYESVKVISEPEFHSSEPRGYAESPASRADAGSGGFEARFPEADPLHEIVSEHQQPAESTQNSEPWGRVPEESEEIIAFAAAGSVPELVEQSPPIQADSPHTDYYDESYSSHEASSASGHVSGEGSSFGFDITPAGQPETTTAHDSAFHNPQDLAGAYAENIQPGTTAEPDEIFAHEFSVAGDDHENLDPEDSFNANDVSESAEIHAPGFSALSSDELEEIEMAAATSPKTHPQRDKEELRQFLTELEDADALEALPTTTLDSIEVDPLTFEVGHVFRKYVTTFGWFILSLGLLGALVLQVVAGNLEFMQRSPSYSRYLPAFCKVLDCPEPARVTAIQSFNSQDLLVRSHPTVPDALEVSFIFRNDADAPQPFPLVELSFMDSGKRLMANRLLKPEEYLPPELTVLDEMPASSSVQVTLEMADPGSEAVNYEIGFRDPATEIPE